MMNHNASILSALENRIVQAVLPEAFRLFLEPQTYWNTEDNETVATDVVEPIICDATECRVTDDQEASSLPSVEKCL